jgi:two-component system, NarL family, sensor histidine kinase UhpB
VILQESTSYDVTGLLLRTLDDGVAQWDVLENRYQYSDRYCQILGFEPGQLELEHRGWIGRVLTEDQPALTNALNQHLRQRTPLDIECRVLTQRGEYRWVHYRGHAQFDASNTATRFIFTMRDIASVKQMEAAIKNGRTQLKNLTLRVVERQESERQQIARELHDEIGQVLTVIKLSLQSVGRNTNDTVPAGRLNDTIGMVDDLAAQVRNLSRLLRPPQLDALGLPSALTWYASSLLRTAGLNVHLTCDPTLARLRPDLESNCFRIVQEALTNVLRHANVQHVAVELRRFEDTIRISIKDNGTGFDVAQVNERTSRGECLGLFGIKERAELLGGSVTINSTLNVGTDIEVTLPLLLAKPRSRANPR